MSVYSPARITTYPQLLTEQGHFMEYLSLAAIGLYIILFTLMITLTLTFIVFNIKAGMKYRQGMAQRLEQLRMKHMLNALGVDLTRYLHQERVHEINQQMNRCQQCENTDQCDSDIAGDRIDTDTIDYCVNLKDLQDIAARQ